MTNFSIIQTGGKQYRVAAGTKVKVEKLKGEAGEPVVFDEVLLKAAGEKVEVGTPTLKGEKVEGKILRQGKDKTKIIFKYSSKSRFRRKKGHRQLFTEVEIIKI